VVSEYKFSFLELDLYRGLFVGLIPLIITPLAAYALYHFRSEWTDSPPESVN
jgi:hypothetical protein